MWYLLTLTSLRFVRFQAQLVVSLACASHRLPLHCVPFSPLELRLQTTVHHFTSFHSVTCCPTLCIMLLTFGYVAPEKSLFTSLRSIFRPQPRLRRINLMLIQKIFFYFLFFYFKKIRKISLIKLIYLI